MKKVLLTLSALGFLALPAAKAQYINPDFETWTHNSGPPAYDDPNTGISNAGWQELNFTSETLLGGSPITVFKDSAANPVPPKHGSYCAKIVTQPMASGTISLIGKYLPNDTLGVLFTGFVNLLSQKIALGIPFTNPITSYSFWYQYAPVGTDTAFCLVTLSRKDTVIGAGETIITSTTSTWTQAMVTIIPIISGNPDTIKIWYSSSSWVRPHIGSIFYVDDATNTGIPSIVGNNSDIAVYPNPANTAVTFKLSAGSNASIVKVFDVTGKMVNSMEIKNNLLSMSTQSLNAGVYLYQVYDKNGNQLNVGKFNVQH